MDQLKYEWISDQAKDMELDAIWFYARKMADTYEGRKDVFLEILRRLLSDGRVKLINMYTREALPGDINQQVAKFRSAMPPTEDGLEEGLWFLLDRCPAGSAWIN